MELDDLLREVVGGDPPRRDRSVSFFQLLVLRSLDILDVEQSVPYGSMILRRGEKWDARLCASQVSA